MLKIPVQFREELEARFDPRNGIFYDVMYYIGTACPLCKAFTCAECPLGVEGGEGCVSFIRSVLGERPVFRNSSLSVSWYKHRDDEARAQLNRLREEAPIEWIE